MKRSRCANGFRKDKDRVCVKKSIRVKGSRCANGFRKDKDRVCVKKRTYDNENKIVGNKITIKKRVSSDRQTPRSIYAKKYFANNKEVIHLLDKINDGDKNVLFQVNYNDVNQFVNYENLHNNPKIDCLFQSIFSLGLHDIKVSKKHSSRVNKYGKIGVQSDEVKLFIKDAFDLKDDEHVEFMVNKMRDNVKHVNRTLKVINNKIHRIFYNHLKNGYATVLYVERMYADGRIGGHYIVMYKYDNQLYFFDPQKKSNKNVNGVFTSTNIHEVLGSKSGNIGYFIIDNLKSPKPLMNTTCPIKYTG
jgi:hypothetical protein